MTPENFENPLSEIESEDIFSDLSPFYFRKQSR